jgi:hypothetical protein
VNLIRGLLQTHLNALWCHCVWRRYEKPPERLGTPTEMQSISENDFECLVEHWRRGMAFPVSLLEGPWLPKPGIVERSLLRQSRRLEEEPSQNRTYMCR